MPWWGWIVVGAGFFVVAMALWWCVPKWQLNPLQITDAKARADVEDNFRKTIGQLVGGGPDAEIRIARDQRHRRRTQRHVRLGQSRRRKNKDEAQARQQGRGLEVLHD